MPGSTVLFQVNPEENEKNSEQKMTSSRQPPPVAPRASVTLQTWQSVTQGGDNYVDNKHARSASMDSLESSGSSSSGGGSSISNYRIIEPSIGEYIPTRVVGKAPKLPSHNPLQFVKVQSPLYKKAEQQIKLTKEVKISREALKEGEEEWQSNLDNWKSRRRKVTEKVIQRAEEMRQIEAEEQLRQEQCLQQQRKIKKFSEIVERRSSRSYNLELYIGQGDDSGLGGTPEPDDVVDSQNSILRSDTSEGMTSEAESVDSDTHKFDKLLEKEAPTVPQKPQLWLKKTIDNIGSHSPTKNLFPEVTEKEIHYDNISSTDPSDIEVHPCDNETISSEEDMSFGDHHTLVTSEEKSDHSCSVTKEKSTSMHNLQNSASGKIHSIKICIKPGDNKGFGFTVKGGKDQGCTPYVESILPDGQACIAGLKEGDEIVSVNGEPGSLYSHASLIFTIKQAIYTGIIELQISHSSENDLQKELNAKPACKKSSFAEKLALFSTGINQTSSNIKSSQSSSKPDIKGESLVLRRRSAFENGKSDKVIQRRSSCLFEEQSDGPHNIIEKRLSVELTSQTHIKKTGIGKKDPPPVPVKPKLKEKSLVTSETINNCKDKQIHQNYLFSAVDSIKQISFFSEGDSEIKSNLLNDSYICSEEDLRIEKNVQTEKDSKIEIFDSLQDENLPLISNCTNIESLVSIDTMSMSDLSQSPKYENQLLIEIDTSDANIDYCSNTNESLNFETSESEHEMLSMESNLDQSKSLHINFDSIRSKIENNSASYVSSMEIPFYESPNADICDAEIPDIEQNAQISVDSKLCDSPKHLNDFSKALPISAYNAECSEICDAETSILDFVQQNANVEHEVSSIEVGSKLDFVQSENLTDVESLIEHTSYIRLNTSPLCLPLEKVDEDDLVSASTSSSETPDTETVIETLPSNLSPLPNDESNGEEAAKQLISSDQQSSAIHETISEVLENATLENISEPLASTNYIEINEEKTKESSSEKPYTSEKFSDDLIDSESDNLAANNDSVFLEDEEYCMELEESLDQITSLDVIDEIENRLMHQLEHQNDNFEDIDKGLSSQLEDDVNDEWLYYSEDLLEDLTPRNLQPPREPPPPPPVEAETEKTLPMSRTNSTKRIKKELWRRRSDFLGLDSPEGIDVDNILPPPPGLEEIFKLEREQNQWLEERLSLVDSDNSSPIASACLDTQDVVQTDYTSAYLLDIEDNSGQCSAVREIWENHEDCSFLPGYETNVLDEQSHISEETVKIKENPQRKAKQNIQNLGAAPKAKIMDSNKWITEKVVPPNKKCAESVSRQTSYSDNYWVTQDVEKRRSYHSDLPNRRHSMASHANIHPDVTLRTWDDRENEFQKQRPRSAVWSSLANDEHLYGSEFTQKQDILRTHSLDDRDDMTCDTGVLESEVHQCSCCGKGLCEGSAMGIEALRLYFHIECFRCCMCQMLLGNGLCGTDVQVKNNQLYCSNCFTVD